jgi:mRNA-degrading endonuclease RelE of RelBE toxin-antitoxin system
VNNDKIYEIENHAEFDREQKRFVKKKKFFTLPEQIDDLVEKFEKGEFEGDKITHSDEPTPYDVYKLRLPNLDTGVGKSNGYRVMYMVVTEKKIVVFLVIYYKKETPTVSDGYIKGLIDGYFLNAQSEENNYNEESEE